MKIYAGIGSRQISPEIYDTFVKIGKYLGKEGYILRSGGADGSDSAFEEGCDLAGGLKEIYIPWKGFNNHKSNLYTVSKEAREIASKYHPIWDKLKDSVKNLHSRNVSQILGGNLTSLVDFVVCYTKEASGAGGTGQALRIAKDYNIPIFDFGDTTAKDKLKEFLNIK